MPRSRSRSSRASSAADGGRLAVVVERRGRQPELVGALGERRRRAARSPRGAPPRAPRRARRPARVHGATASRGAKPGDDAAQRRVSLPDRGRVLGRQRRTAGSSRPSDAVEVRAARGGPALDDRQPVGREDERRHLGAELLGRAQRRAVQLRPLASPRRSVTSSSSGRPPLSPRERDPRAVGAEADELRVRPRPRREALRADVQRLEQVRLARRRSGRPRARGPARARARAARTSGSRGARPCRTIRPLPASRRA